MSLLDRGEFERRRRRLARQMGPDSMALLPSAPLQKRNRDVEYPYRPCSNFYYCTGFAEPEALAVVQRRGKDAELVLFCRERDPQKEAWSGRRAGQEGAVRQYGAQRAYPIDKVAEVLPGMLEHSRRLYYSLGNDQALDRQVIAWLAVLRERAQGRPGSRVQVVALDHLLQEMRLCKSRAELHLMRVAAAISARAHRRAMQLCRPGMYEYELEAELLHEFVRSGARAPAYPPIVGGGANACVLHYVDNSAPLRDGDLVLIDAGAEYGFYAADITRTFPVNGRFSDAQRQLYELVLAAQRAAIRSIAPGRNWNAPHRAAVRVLTRGLIELGILKGDLDKLVRDEAYRRFYMHRTGHWLGMDVHDVGEYRTNGRWRGLQAGMVLTVEPGLYIPAGSKGVARRWWNTGIRIEDDVLVTKTGCELLSAAVPKEVAEIEALMSEAH